MKRFVALLLFFIILLVMSGCVLFKGGVRTGGVIDYYGEYYFVLPFNHIISYNIGDTLYFTTDNSLKEMKEAINDAGYLATLHTNGETETILISVEQNHITYHFIIFDADYSGIFTLSNALSNTWMGVFHGELAPSNLPFLAPLHMLEPRPNTNLRRRVFGSFNEIEYFYLKAGRNYVVVDRDKKTIFFHNGNSRLFTPIPGVQTSVVRGTIALRFVSVDDENFLYIEIMRN
ncbi:MAG: hypothetical protein FWB98_02885 [Defluviitaleaceae bacterium]|nr:hypothetical protein [Defluviitaleaceae bacterium]